MTKRQEIINNLQEIHYDLQYLRDKVMIDKEVKEELTRRMRFLDDLSNDFRDDFIKIVGDNGGTKP